MKVLKYLSVIALVGIMGCTLFGGSTISSPANPSSSPQSVARTLVITLVDVWNITGQACVDVSASEGVDGGGQDLRDKCNSVMAPALATLQSAALLVDSWDSAAQANFGCAIARFTQAIDNTWMTLGQTEPILVKDSLQLGENFTSACVNDAGGQ